MDRQRVSFAMGQRLKELREERGLSHVDLMKQLNDKYGVSISRDSLMAYEISDEMRAKASKLPNLGMRVEYLYCLADFFGVSLDYLLGKNNVKTPNCTVQSVCEYTGFDEETLRAIKFFENGGKAGALNALLKNPCLFSVLGLIYRAAEAPDYLDEPLHGGSAIPDVSTKAIYESLAVTRAVKLIEGAIDTFKEDLQQSNLKK